MKAYQLDASALVKAVEKLIGQKTGITEADLLDVSVQETFSEAKADAL